MLLVPAALTSLRTLDASNNFFPAGWVGQLSALRQLRDLNLCLDVGDTAEASADFPALPSLSRLALQLVGDATIRVCLPHLPALRSVRVWGSGTADLTSPGSSISTAPASHLKGLCLLSAQARLDFALMPALQNAQVEVLSLDGAATIAAASALTALVLGGDAGDPLDVPWVAELLRHLPASVKKLRMMNNWSNEAAKALGRLTQLRALQLAGDNPPMPPADAPLWRKLTSLYWDNATESAEHMQVPPVSEHWRMRLPAFVSCFYAFMIVCPLVKVMEHIGT